MDKELENLIDRKFEELKKYIDRKFEVFQSLIEAPEAKMDAVSQLREALDDLDDAGEDEVFNKKPEKPFENRLVKECFIPFDGEFEFVYNEGDKVGEHSTLLRYEENGIMKYLDVGGKGILKYCLPDIHKKDKKHLTKGTKIAEVYQ